MKNTERLVTEMCLSFTVCVVNSFISAVVFSAFTLVSVNVRARMTPGHFTSTEMERCRRSILPNQFPKFGAVLSNCGIQTACCRFGLELGKKEEEKGLLDV